MASRMPDQPYYPPGAIRYEWLIPPETAVWIAGGVRGEIVKDVLRHREKTCNIPKYNGSTFFAFTNYFHALAWSRKCKRLEIYNFTFNERLRPVFFDEVELVQLEND